MKKILSLLFVLALVLSCFVGCKKSVSVGTSSSASSEIKLDENRPSDTEVGLSIQYYVRSRGYELFRHELVRADYNSTTKTCIVEAKATLFDWVNQGKKYDACYRFTYKLADDGSWEQQDKYPVVLYSDFMPPLK